MCNAVQDISLLEQTTSLALTQSTLDALVPDARFAISDPEINFPEPGLACLITYKNRDSLCRDDVQL